MGVTTLLVTWLIGASAVAHEDVRWFPGDYFNSRIKDRFQDIGSGRFPVCPCNSHEDEVL